MASFPYNSSSLLFQQRRNISPPAVEEANSPQCCSQAGHEVRAKTPQVLATMDVKGLWVHPGKLQVPGNHQFPPSSQTFSQHPVPQSCSDRMRVHNIEMDIQEINNGPLCPHHK